jgi:alpha-galactosidase
MEFGTLTLEDLSIPIPPGHQKLIITQLVDQTDHHDNLVFEQEYLLAPNETKIEATAAVFAIEDILSGEGMIFLKHAALPESRQIKGPADLVIEKKKLQFHSGGYPYVVLKYADGAEGRIRALQEYQMSLRPYVAGRDGLLLTNTWGDRSGDKKLNEEFILAEIDAAAKVGADVVQIDEGWQQGKTADLGGQNEGYWSQHDFWKPSARRFPNGLKPLVDSAKKKNMQMGLWFSPDSLADFANWESDVDVLLHLHQNEGINFFKLDGVKIRSRAGEINFDKLVQTLVAKSGGKITIDLDTTNQIRPGYFGQMNIGPVFVENRYSDWHNYWPHHTLRNLWKLAHTIHPARLRMEFLNNFRSEKLYEGDPLGPGKYDPAYVFATVMFSSPLGWFENSMLPEKFVNAVAPVVKVWKEHRDAIFSRPIIPIGETPCGNSWSGFVAGDPKGVGYVLIFRELNDRKEFDFKTGFFPAGEYSVERLAGAGEVSVSSAGINARMDRGLSFCFARVRRR